MDWSQFLPLYVVEIYCLNYPNGWNDYVLNKYISFEARNNQLRKGREMSSGVDKNRVVYFLLNSLSTPPPFLFLIPDKMCFLKRVVEQWCMGESRTLNYSGRNYSLSSDWCCSLSHLRHVPVARANSSTVHPHNKIVHYKLHITLSQLSIHLTLSKRNWSLIQSVSRCLLRVLWLSRSAARK